MLNCQPPLEQETTVHRTLLAKIARELPVLAFFVLIGVLCVLPENRDITMPDHLMTFDHWWNFHHRLRQGELAQWNPYSGPGRVAVQWNHVPVSIFTPALLVTELTVEKLYALHLVGTFLTILAVYLVGRILGYGRLLPLLPVGLVLLGKLRYHNHPVMFSTLLLFFPLAAAMLVSAVSATGPQARRRKCAFVVLLALSLVGARLESLVQVLAFVSVAMFSIILLAARERRSRLGWAALAVAALTLAVAANAWHLSLITEATVESGRAATGVHLGKLFRSASVVWLGRSLLYRPTLLLVVLNIALLAVLRLRRAGQRKVLRWPTVVAAIGVDILLVLVLVLLPTTAGRSLSNPFKMHAAALPVIDHDLIFSWAGAAAIVLALAIFLSRGKERSWRELTGFLAALFSGFYLADYLNTANVFMPLPAASFLACGAVVLWLSGRSWIVATLVLFHLLSEVGGYFLNETVNILWICQRAAVLEVPFKAVLILETTVAAVNLGGDWIGHRFHSLDLATVRRRLGQLVAAMACTAAFAMAWIGFPPRQLPAGMFRDWQEQIQSTRDRSLAIRAEQGDLHESFDRLPVSGFHNFFPCYSQRLNTATVYASEIPSLWKSMFASGAEAPDNNSYPGHPEISPALKKFLSGYLHRQARSYQDDVILKLTDSDDPLNTELAAAKGSGTPRIFMTPAVVKLPDGQAEREYLRNLLNKGEKLSNQVTTSDRRFADSIPAEKRRNPDYSVAVRQDLPERIVLTTRSRNDGFLVLMDTFSPGWRAFVDGQETPIYRGYVGARFVAVGRGEHAVEFSHQPPAERVA